MKKFLCDGIGNIEPRGCTWFNDRQIRVFLCSQRKSIPFCVREIGNYRQCASFIVTKYLKYHGIHCHI